MHRRATAQRRDMFKIRRLLQSSKVTDSVFLPLAMQVLQCCATSFLGNLKTPSFSEHLTEC